MSLILFVQDRVARQRMDPVALSRVPDVQAVMTDRGDRY